MRTHSTTLVFAGKGSSSILMQPLLTSAQIQRYVLLPAVIPTCRKQAQRTAPEISPASLCARETVFSQHSIATSSFSLLGLPRIRRLRIGRPRKLAAMFPGRYTTPETSRLVARPRRRESLRRDATDAADLPKGQGSTGSFNPPCNQSWDENTHLTWQHRCCMPSPVRF